MLLRSITKHVREQNWFAVFLDFLIVVVGILIAFQITNWNAALKERALEDQYLERLDMEFDVIRTRLSGGMEVFEDSVRNIDLLLKAHRDYSENTNNPLPSDDVLMAALWDTASGRIPAGTPAAFKEMVANGALGTLESRELRHALFAYDEFSTIAREGWKTIRDSQRNSSNGIDSLVDVVAPVVDLDTLEINDLTAKPIGFNRAGFLENTETRGYLNILMNSQINQFALVTHQLTLAEEVEALIAQERQ